MSPPLSDDTQTPPLAAEMGLFVPLPTKRRCANRRPASEGRRPVWQKCLFLLCRLRLRYQPNPSLLSSAQAVFRQPQCQTSYPGGVLLSRNRKAPLPRLSLLPQRHSRYRRQCPRPASHMSNRTLRIQLYRQNRRMPSNLFDCILWR